MKRYSRADLHDLVVALTLENAALRRQRSRKPAHVHGIGFERTRRNPTERVVDEQWRAQQDRVRPMLALLLAPDSSVNFLASPSERDYEVAATVMQWLGSAVGQSFLFGIVTSPEWKKWLDDLKKMS